MAEDREKSLLIPADSFISLMSLLPEQSRFSDPADMELDLMVKNSVEAVIASGSKDLQIQQFQCGASVYEDTHLMASQDFDPGSVDPVSSSSTAKSDVPPRTVDHAHSSFRVDSSAIRSVPVNEQAEELRQLGLDVYDQTVFEEGILEQVDKAYQQQEEARHRQEIHRSLEAVLDDIRSVKVRLKHIDKALSMLPKVTEGVSKDIKRQTESIMKEKENKLKHLKALRAKQRHLLQISSTSADANTDVDSSEEMDPELKLQLEQLLNFEKAKETSQEQLIRTGQMTPFGTVHKPNKIKISEELTDFEKYLMDQAQLNEKKKKTTAAVKTERKKIGNSSKDVEHPSEPPTSSSMTGPSTSKSCPPLVPKKKRKRGRKVNVGTLIEGRDDKKLMRNRAKWHGWPDPEANTIDLEEFEKDSSGESEYAPSSDEEENSDVEERIRHLNVKGKSGKRLKTSHNGETSQSSGRKKVVDDGNQDDYLKRIKAWKRVQLIKKHQKIVQEVDGDEGSDAISEDDDDGYEEFEGGYRIPLRVWNKLYRYQQTGVRWLWELHCQKCGGIVGDEMGLGKTIQIISYLAGLSESPIRSRDCKWKGLGPVIIVAPTTVMHQWVKEFHVWWPPFRVAILHESGSYSGTKESLVRNINQANGILITSYTGISSQLDNLLRYAWHYIILDEGHKIRNPDARTTLACKQFRTPHRLILSGSPLQNHLKELWSLFDFIFPGKLGTLPVFLQQFSVPITQGGYSNASTVQVQTAYRCAVVLRDTIAPYLLRRMKADVKMNINLPTKNEQVLFCRLTDEQRELYKEYLDSKEVKSILDGRLQVFVGLINLRKICNHSDLYSGGPKIFGKVDPTTLGEDLQYGYWKRSGKMVVISAILKLWHRQGHRVLLFSQSKQMLDILERFVKIQDYTYLRMDGGTAIGSRQPLVAKFNNDPAIFIFLLTTRVGGLGVNLTGANRVVIFDPDWNPSTDLQARERAWRIGQQRDVTIYRLLTSGTIEEKIYHRQIFKQFLTNRVLKDPKQRRFFKSNDMFELFVLRDEGSQGTETGAIFAGTGSEVQIPQKKAGVKVAKGSPSSKDLGTKTCLSEDKIQKMWALAKKLSQKIGEKSRNNGQPSTTDVEAQPTASTSSSEVVKTSKKTSKNNVQKKKKRKSSKFEGIVVENLVGKDTFQSTGQENEEAAKSQKQDEYVLQKLFAKTNVHAALKHDTIIDASDPDYMLVEGEADRVAKEAVKALKASRRQCYRAEAGIPSWTGANGMARTSAPTKPRFGQKKNTQVMADHAPESSNKLAQCQSKKVFSGETADESTTKNLSSSHLLARMKERSQMHNSSSSSSDENEGEESAELRTTTEYDELLVDVRNFLAFQCTVEGQATTNEILNHFKSRIPGGKDTAVFKALLNKICVFSRNLSGDGIWQLKGEFR